MSDGSLTLDLDTDAVECGDAVIGEVRWVVPQGATGREVRVRAVFHTGGDASPPDSGGPPGWSHPAGTSGSERFELWIPRTGPMTFTGRTISVRWQVEAVLDLAHAGDITAVEEVTVLPDGGLAIWARAKGAPPLADPDNTG